MGLMSNYMVLWVASLASSVGIIFVATFVGLVFGEDGNFVLSLSAMAFNMTASGFILFTMIPVIIVTVGSGLIINFFGPIAYWLVGGFIDLFLASITFLIMGSTETYSPLSGTFIPMDIEGTVAVVNDTLETLKGLLITEIVTAGGRSAAAVSALVNWFN